MTYVQERQAAGEVVTGLLYVDDEAGDLNDRMNTVETPLNTLGEAELCPGAGGARGDQRGAALRRRTPSTALRVAPFPFRGGIPAAKRSPFRLARDLFRLNLPARRAMDAR